MTTRAKLFSQLAKSVDTNGTITSNGISSTVSLGATVYDSIGELPMSGYTAGEQAFVKSTSRLYINSGVGWYNVAVINNTPTIQSILDSDSGPGPFSLATDGTATTITITAQDSDGDALTYTASADSDFNGLATISQVSNVFTITPFSQDSATTSSGTITFNVTDNINIANSVQTFTLNFLSALWDETVLSVGTSSTNSLGNSTFIDRSTNAIAVTPTGSPTQTAFHPYLDYWSAEFDGSGDYLTASANSAFNFGTGDFTVEAWVNKTAGGGGIWTNGPTSSGSFGFYMQGTGELRCDYYGGTGLIGTTQIPDNVWHHVAVSRNGSDLSLYINGVRDATTTTSSNNTTSSFAIGRAWTNNPGEIAGYISNLRIIKGTAIYTGASYTTPTEPLTAISGTSALTCQSNSFVDNSSNDHTITANGTPKVSAFNPFGQESEYAVGENKGSGYFDGSGDYLAIPNDAGFKPGSTGYYHCEFWYYASGGQDGAIIGNYRVTSYPSNTSGWDILASGGSGQNVSLRWGYPNYIDSGNHAVNVNAWNHIVFVRDSDASNLSLFVNGTRVYNNTTNTNVTDSSENTFWVGWAGSLSGTTINPFKGSLADVKIVKGGTEIYDASATTLTPPTAPVGAANASLYVPMDNAGIFDKTGNHTLTLLGDTATSNTQTKFADKSFSLDGTDDAIVIYDNLDLLNLKSGPFTIEAWYYQTASSSYATIASMHDPNSDKRAWAICQLSTGNMGYYVSSNGTGTSSRNGGSKPLNTWTHIALTRDDSDVVRLFINGTQGGTNLSFPSIFDTAGAVPLVIGGQWSSGSPYREFPGYIENLQILQGVAKYTANFTPPTSTQGRAYQAES